MGFDEWWQLNARFGDDKVRFRQLWSAAIECAQRETVRYAEVQVAAERERWQRIASAAQAVTAGAEDIGDFLVSSSLMSALALALDEGPNAKLNGGP